MPLRLSLAIGSILLFPATAFAYGVSEQDYWQAFTLSLINASRAEAGLPAIGLDSELSAMSQSHAADTATHYDDSSSESRRASYIIHTGSDGGNLGDRVRYQGIRGAAAFGENVGLRFRTAFSDVHAALEESLKTMHEMMMAEVPPDDGHRKTILGEYTHVGVGLELHRPEGGKQNTIFLVTDFGRFTDGRATIIPRLGARPVWLPPERRAPEEPAIPKAPRRVRESRMFPAGQRRKVRIMPRGNVPPHRVQPPREQRRSILEEILKKRRERIEARQVRTRGM